MVDKKIKSSKMGKEECYIQRKEDEKSLITLFGEVKYKRNYYKHKNTGEYCYLADDKLGIAPHEIMDLSVKSRLIDEATDLSYEKSSKKS